MAGTHSDQRRMKGVNVGVQLERESCCRGVLVVFEALLELSVVRRGTEGRLAVQRRAARSRHRAGPWWCGVVGCWSVS